jgi:hypothetical protein
VCLLLLLRLLLLLLADDVTISAKPSGISKVYYTRGKCDAGQQVRPNMTKPLCSARMLLVVRLCHSVFGRYYHAIVPTVTLLFSCRLLLQLSVDVPFFSMDLGLSSCVKVQGSAFSRYKATWKCGLKATGASMCTPGVDSAAAANP